MKKQEVIQSDHGYIEYRPGDLNVILSVPHGGCMRPACIPDRDAGYAVNGRNYSALVKH